MYIYNISGWKFSSNSRRLNLMAPKIYEHFKK